MKKILFISHDASRTGAPMIVLFLLEWLKIHHKNILIDTVLVSGGSLEGEFKNLSNVVFNYEDICKTKRHSLIVRVLNKIIKNSPKLNFFKKLSENNYDLIYANSVVSVPLANEIKNYLPKSKLLLHIHELENIIKSRVPNFNLYSDNIDRFIVPSNIVRDNLLLNYNINTNRIVKIHEFSKLKKTPYNIVKDSVFRVGACGTVSLRKGFDFFIQVAKSIKKKSPNIKIEFVWIGGNVELLDLAKSDVLKMGLGDTVYFIGEQAELMNHFKNIDVFLLTSREDPFPLVCIDVATLGKPIICFNKGVGTAEVLKNGGGHVVDYLDIDAVVDKVMNYYNNPMDLIKDGEEAKKIFSMFTPENMCPIIFDELKNLLEIE